MKLKKGIKLLQIKPKRVLVIGDSFFDEYIDGEVYRVSQEAPVPIVAVSKDHTFSLGGAANTAANVKSLGGVVTLVTLLGEDSAGGRMAEALRNLEIDLAQFSDGRITSKKVRIRARGQQMLRLDYEETHEMAMNYIYDHLDMSLKLYIQNHDAVIVSDYGKGLLDGWRISLICQLCQDYQKLLVIDPKNSMTSCYKNAAYVTPNEKEMMELCSGYDTPEEAAQAFSNINHCGVLLTKGAKGITLIGGGKVIKNWPTQAKEVFDVSGAGDTVTAAFTLAMASGATEEEAVVFANKAAGVVVGKHGTATVKLEEIQ